MISILNKIRFRLIRAHSLKKTKSTPDFDKEAIYLTFDDGPEPGITEFVLDELKKYGVKGTFFCKGENCIKFPELFKRIIEEGHAVANHTYSHINGLETPCKDYIENVEKCELSTKSHIFRPPWGKLTLKQYFKLSKEYKVVLWNIASGDTDLSNFDLEKSLLSLQSNTRKGSVVLFHFCNLHEKETKQILPEYLKFLAENKYKTQKIH